MEFRIAYAEGLWTPEDPRVDQPPKSLPLFEGMYPQQIISADLTLFDLVPVDADRLTRITVFVAGIRGRSILGPWKHQHLIVPVV